MKHLTRFWQNRCAARRLELLALPLLLAVAAYLWTAPIRAERALRSASFDTLIAASKREPNNPRVFYHLGLRLQTFGQIGPARAAFARAATLDGDDEDSWLAWAAMAGALGSDQEAFATLTQFLKTHPRSERAHFALALFYHEEDALQRAYEEALAAARINFGNAAAWRLAGVEALALNKYPEAESALRQALAHDPRDWRAQLALGNALTEARREGEALACYEKAAALAPDQAATVLALGRAQLKRAANPSDLEGARQTLARAVALNPNAAPALLALGQAYLRAGRWQEARQILQNAERLAPADPEIHFSLRRVYLRLGDTADAARETRLHVQAQAYRTEKYNLLSSIYQVKNDPQLRLKLARLCAAHGEYAEAAREYRRLIGRAAALEVAQKELAALERWHPEVVHHAVALPLPPEASPTRLALATLLRDADAMLAQKRYAEAERAYANALARDPNSALAYQGLGVALDGQGNKEEAFQALAHAIRLCPNLPEAEFTLARLYFDAGFVDEAAHRMEHVVKEAPDNAKYWHAYGLACAQHEARTVEAEAAFRRAVALLPGRADYLRDLARGETHTHKLTEAQAHYRQALQRAPNDPATMLALGLFLIDHQPTAARQREAEGLLQKSAAAYANNPEALMGLGRIALNRGDARQATAYLEAAVMRAPNLAPAWYHLARAYDRLGDRKRAASSRTIFQSISDYNTTLYDTEVAAHNRLKDPALRLKLARLYAQGSQNAKAINQYQMCLTLDPKNADARKELQAFVARLKAQGQLPSMTALNGMLLASIQAR